MYLGEVEGLLHATCLSRRTRDINARSSGKVRLKIVEFGKEAKAGRNGVMAGENPSNGTGETARPSRMSVSASKGATIQNAISGSVCAVVSVGG